MKHQHKQAMLSKCHTFALEPPEQHHTTLHEKDTASNTCREDDFDEGLEFSPEEFKELDFN